MRYADRGQARHHRLGQVNGWRGETSTVEQIENRVRLRSFLRYDNWSLPFDLKIVALTILREIHSQHAF